MDPRTITGDQLVEAWDAVKDGEHLTNFEAVVLAEIERRNIDL